MSANFFSRAVSSTSRKSLGVVAAAVVLSAAFTVPVLYTPHAALADSTSAVQSALAPGFASVVDIVKPAVVNIATERQQTSSTRHPNTEGQSLRDLLERHLGHQQRPVTGQGSGFLVSAKGEVVTNYHVIAHADEIVVTLDDGRKLPATLVGVDRRTDLALLRVEHDTPFPYVDIASAHTVRVGDWVLAIGNPFGLGGSVTAGIVSARGRDLGSGPYDDFIQVDAPINRGNSGGPLFDGTGKFIGVNTAIVSPNGGSVGVGFAIPSRIVADVVSDLREHGQVHRGWLGVQLQALNEPLAASLRLSEPSGALIVSVSPGTPASDAELAPGDVVLEANAVHIESPRDLRQAVGALEPDQNLDLVIWRDQRRLDVAVTVGLLDSQLADTNIPADSQTTGKPRIGVGLVELTDSVRAQFGINSTVSGALVVSVDPQGLAAQEHIRPGDVIVQIGSAPIRSPADVSSAVAAAFDDQRDSVLLLVNRKGNSQFVAVPLV